MSSGKPLFERSIVWLRRDLRLRDNVALHESSLQSRHVCLAFVVNPPLLGSDRMGAPLVNAFFTALAALRDDVRELGSDLAILEGDFATELLALAKQIDAQAVFFNEDYEPKAVERDREVTKALEERGIVVRQSLDHVYYGAGEILTSGGAPYKVFTPYKRRWLDLFAATPRPPVPSERAARTKLVPRGTIGITRAVPRPEDFGFAATSQLPDASEEVARRLLGAFARPRGPMEAYQTLRDEPAKNGTSHLSPQLRAGTIGIRTCVAKAATRRESNGPVRESVDTWISELIWRDFYQMILKWFPHVADGPFSKAGERIVWRNDQAAFQAWCEGRTGYPLVDAAMRQLNTFGWMHNRLRMVTASFLTKHLLIDWRAGERYFERQLADADLAANNGGWQWAASTGTDAVPYFRIFNPVLQSKRFDPEGKFIKAMVPELRNLPAEFVHEPWRAPPILQEQAGVAIGTTYPAPIVEHAFARKRALEAYGRPA